MQPPASVRALVVAVLLAGCTTQPGTAPTSDASSPAAVTAASVADEPPPPTPTPTATPPPEPPPVRVDPFDGEAAHAFAVALAEMGTRDSGTPGDEAARAVIVDALEAAGWTVVEEAVPLPQGGTTANVVAVRDEGDLDRPHVVVGGHHDTRGGSPGANDNATGIGVLVAVAEELADEDPAVPIVLVAFGAEEYQPSTPREHHLGSQAYVDLRAEHVLAALVVDMVGNGPVTCICWFDAGPSTLAERLTAVVEEASLTGYRQELRGDLSDHGPFARRGLPAAFLWTYGDGVLHTPADTPDRIRAQDMQRSGDLVLAFVRTLAPADLEGLRASP